MGLSDSMRFLALHCLPAQCTLELQTEVDIGTALNFHSFTEQGVATRHPFRRLLLPWEYEAGAFSLLYGIGLMVL